MGVKALPLLDDSQIFLVKNVRVILLFCISIIFLIFQANQPHFINFEVFIPVFTLLSISFLINSFFLTLFEKAFSKSWVQGLLFAYDALCIFILAFYTGQQTSIFIFLFLVNIILCGVIHQRGGAFVLSLWTSILFSALVIFSGVEVQASVGASVVVNNLSFFAVALLSGILGHKIQNLDETVSLKEKHIQSLAHLNDLIVENIGTGLVTIDRWGAIHHSNPFVDNLFHDHELPVQKLPVQSLKGQSLYNYLPQLRGEFRPDEKTSLSALSPTHRLEMEWEDKVLEIIWSNTYDPISEFYGYTLLIQDLTKIKNLERAVRQQEKLAAVGQLAAGIAHEIRNPLTSMSGSIQLLAAGNSTLTTEERKLMGIVSKEMDRLNHLISEFLEYVKPTTRGKKEPVNINLILSEVLEMVKFNKDLPKDIQQTMKLEAKNWIHGHHGKLKQAFLNIIINAYQSMSKNEKGMISAETFEDGNNHLVVEIKDTGEGIEEKTIHRIFEPFHTTKAKGTGLGLAMTYKILENHGADIQVKSKKDIGTTFLLRFPLSPTIGQGEENTNVTAG